MRKALLCLCTLAALALPAYAATANDIYAAYGFNAQADTKELREDLLRVQQTIRSIEEVTVYNQIIESLSTEEIDKEIASLTARADTLYRLITTGVDIPFEELLRREAEYADVTARLDTLLQTRGYYEKAPLPEVDADLALLLSQESRLEKSIEKAATFTELGDLKYYPVKGQPVYVTSPFGYRYDPIGEKGYSFHSGIDLRSPMNTPIGAWFSGVVRSAGYSNTSGYYVWLDHGNGIQTYYCHLNHIDVKQGQSVRQGEQIARSGNTGSRSTGPHLHLAIYVNNTALDPEVLFP